MAEQGSIRIGPGGPSAPPNGTGSMVTSVLQRNPIGLVRATSNISLTHDSNGQGNDPSTSTTTFVNSEPQQQVMTQSRALPTSINNDTSNTDTNRRQNKRKIFLHPLTGSPLRIYITRHTPDREDLKKLIHVRTTSTHKETVFLRRLQVSYQLNYNTFSLDSWRKCNRTRENGVHPTGSTRIPLRRTVIFNGLGPRLCSKGAPHNFERRNWIPTQTGTQAGQDTLHA